MTNHLALSALRSGDRMLSHSPSVVLSGFGTRERHEVKRPGTLPSVRAATFSGESFMETFSGTRNAASPRGVCYWSTDASADCRRASRGHSSRGARSTRVHFSECLCLSKLGQGVLVLCSPSSSPISRGLCTAKRRRFNDLGEMKACLQSRCFGASAMPLHN